MERRRSQPQAEVHSAQAESREALCKRCKRPLGERALEGEGVNRTKIRERGGSKIALVGLKGAQPVGNRGRRRRFEGRKATMANKRAEQYGAKRPSRPEPQDYVPIGVATAEEIAENYISRQAPPPPRSMLIDPSEI